MENSTLQINTDFVFVDKLKIKFGLSKIDGRGVFATEKIYKDELIERCPLIQLQNRSRYHTDYTIWKYCFPKPLCDCDECKNHGFMFYMMSGHGMIYNHQDDNNATVKFNYKDGYADFIAIKDIDINEEVFVNYGNDYFKNLEKRLVKDVT